jgi:hypothetical protein
MVEGLARDGSSTVLVLSLRWCERAASPPSSARAKRCGIRSKKRRELIGESVRIRVVVRPQIPLGQPRARRSEPKGRRSVKCWSHQTQGARLLRPEAQWPRIAGSRTDPTLQTECQRAACWRPCPSHPSPFAALLASESSKRTGQPTAIQTVGSPSKQIRVWIAAS